MMQKKYRVYFAAAITLFGVGGIGCVFIFLFRLPVEQQIQFPDIFFNGNGLLAGCLYGIVAGFAILLFLQMKILKPASQFFTKLLNEYHVNFFDIILLSLSAGIGEELLFRGAIQHWLGIWPTAVVFIFLHGYLHPGNKPLFIYGLILLPVSAGFGYLLVSQGIIAAMIAHFLIDVILMQYMLKKRNN